MIIFQRYALLFFMLVFTACSSNKLNISEAGFAGIDLDAPSSSDKVQPLINVVKISKDSEEQKDGEVAKVIGLVFGPGMNRTIGYVPVINRIQERDIPYHVVMGSGLGAVVATYLAMGESHNQIEWNLYQLLKKLEDLKPYSDEWVNVIDETVLQKIKGKKIQGLEKTLIIPLYDTKKDEMVYFHQGDLYLALKYNFQLTNGNDQKFISALRAEPFNVSKLENFSVDSWFGFDVLGDEFSFDKIGDDYLVGVLGKTISLRNKQADQYRHLFQLPMTEMPLDAKDNIPRYVKYVDDRADDIADELLDLIKK